MNALSSPVSDVRKERVAEFQDCLIQLQAGFVSPPAESNDFISELIEQYLHCSFISLKTELEHWLAGECQHEIISDVTLPVVSADRTGNLVCFHR